MKISSTYQFSFPTVQIVESSLGLNPRTLSAYPLAWTSIDINYPSLGSVGAYFSIPVSGQLKGITGIDIPVLISNPNESTRGTVVIFAQDPLRSVKNYSSVQWNMNYIVSLPFAVHCNLGSMLCIYNTVDLFLKNGYSVYITDSHKIYCKGQKQQDDIQCLKSELASLKNITAIVTFGNQAKTTAGELNCSAQQETFIHPSGSANAKWNGVLPGLGCSMANKWNYIKAKLCKDLSLVP